jgi:hypothetical protein
MRTETVTLTETNGVPRERAERKIRGLLQRTPGVWWIRYADATGGAK